MGVRRRVRFLISADPVAVQMRRTAVFKIFPLCDPDGVARGGVRFNAHGFDLNRNWDAVDETKMPEIAAQRKAILDWVDAGRRVDMFVSLHNTETAEYLEGPPDADGRYSALTQRLFKLLSESQTFAPTGPPQAAEASTTPGQAGADDRDSRFIQRPPASGFPDRTKDHPTSETRATANPRRPPAVRHDLARAMWKAVTQ